MGTIKGTEELLIRTRFLPRSGLYGGAYCGLVAAGIAVTSEAEKARIQNLISACIHLGVSENRGPKYSTLNSRVLIIRTPNKIPLISETPI